MLLPAGGTGTGVPQSGRTRNRADTERVESTQQQAPVGRVQREHLVQLTVFFWVRIAQLLEKNETLRRADGIDKA